MEKWESGSVVGWYVRQVGVEGGWEICLSLRQVGR